MKHKELISELAGRTGWALDDVGGILSALALEIGTRLVDNKIRRCKRQALPYPSKAQTHFQVDRKR